MAQITLNIPDAVIPRLRQAFASNGQLPSAAELTQLVKRVCTQALARHVHSVELSAATNAVDPDPETTLGVN